MRTLAFLLRRFAAQRLLGLAIVVALAFTTGVLVAGPVYADASREAIASAAVRTAPVNVRNVRLSFYGSPGAAYGDLDTAVRDTTANLPVARYVAQALGEVRMAGDRGPTVSIPVLFREGAEDHFTAFEGSAPAGEGEVALMRDVAKRLGVGIGDAVTVIGPTDTERTFRVTGLYERPRPDDPFWFGSQTPIPEEEGAELPPGLLSSEGYVAMAADLGLSSQFVWDLYIDLGGVRFDEAQRLPPLIERDAASLRGQPGLSDLRVSTGLGALFELTRQRVADLRVPILLVVFQVAAVALAVLAGVGALVVSRQSFELAVLRSRGFSRGKLLVGQSIQAIVSALIAYPLGLLLGVGLARLAARSNGPSLPSELFPIGIGASALALGILGAAAGAAALVLVSLPHLRRTILEERRLVSREDRPLLARIPVELFILPLAAFTFIELRGIRAASTIEQTELNPLVLLTPTLVIFGASFLALRLLLWALRRMDRRIGRSRRVSTYLTGRRLGRAPGTSFSIALLLLLSVGLMVVASSYRAIVLRNQEDTAHQQIGADWRVEIAVPEQPLAALDELPANATGVVRVVPYLEIRPRFPLTTVALSVDPRTFERGGWWRGDYSEVPEDTWLRDLAVDDPGVPVPTGATPGTLTIDAEPLEGADGLELVATVEDRGGEIHELVLGELGAGYAGTATDREALDGARLLAIAVRTPEATGPDRVSVRIDAIGGRAAGPLLSSWEALRWRGSDATVERSGDGVIVNMDTGVGHVLGGIAPPAGPLPALVSPGIARSQGGVFRASVGGQLLEFRAVARAEHFPTAPSDFFVTSTPALLRAMGRVPEAGASLGEVWAMGTDPRPALERAGLLVRTTASAAPIEAFLAQLPASLAVGLDGATAVGALGLVTIGVAVGLSLVQRRRAFEFASLRAMGVERTTIARIVVLEQAVLLGFAVVAGFALGYGVLRWLLPYVGRSIGAPFPPPLLVMDRTALGLALVDIVVATTIGVAIALRALLRTSVTGILRGEAE